MKSCSRGRDCAFMLGVDRLESFFILWLYFTLDVFWKRSFSKSFNYFIKCYRIAIKQKANCPSSGSCVIDNFSHKVSVTEIEFIAYADFPCRVNENIPQMHLGI